MTNLTSVPSVPSNPEPTHEDQLFPDAETLSFPIGWGEPDDSCEFCGRPCNAAFGVCKSCSRRGRS